LSPDQEKFRQRLEAQGILLHVCYTAQEAIAIVRRADCLNNRSSRDSRFGMR
jgi:hypothetical protein